MPGAQPSGHLVPPSLDPGPPPSPAALTTRGAPSRLLGGRPPHRATPGGRARGCVSPPVLCPRAPPAPAQPPAPFLRPQPACCPAVGPSPGASLRSVSPSLPGTRPISAVTVSLLPPTPRFVSSSGWKFAVASRRDPVALPPGPFLSVAAVRVGGTARPLGPGATVDLAFPSRPTPRPSAGPTAAPSGSRPGPGGCSPSPPRPLQSTRRRGRGR